MPPTPCRPGEETVTKKGKTYCRKQKFYHCKELQQNIKELKGLVSLLIRSKMNSRHNQFIPKQTNIPKPPPQPPKPPPQPPKPPPQPPKPPPQPPKPSTSGPNKVNLKKTKGFNAVLNELRTKIKQKN